MPLLYVCTCRLLGLSVESSMKQKNGNDPNNTHFLNYPALSNGDRKKGVIRFLKNL